MEFDHRKFLLISKRDSKDCHKKCLKLNNICMDDDDCEKELKKPSESSHLDEGQMARKSLLITGSLVSAVFLFCLVFMIAKRYFARRNAAASNRRFGDRNVPILFDTQENFLDEEHGPIADHHVWYINTVGLPQAVIDSISICKYKRGDGLIECTECSVCLSEFDEDESLRLLPKCSHAFHVSCIDTWLRAHKSCPLCRAPIVCARAEEGDLRPTQENGLIESSESHGGAVNMVEQGESSGAREARVEADLLGSSGSQVGPIRRSVSMEAVKGSNLVALSKRMRSSSTIGVSSQRVTGSTKIVRSGSSGRRVFGSKHRRTQSSIIVA